MPKTSSAPKKFFRRSGETIKNSYRRHTKWWIIGIVVLIGLIVGLAVGLTVGKGDSAKILSQAEVETALASGDFTIQSNEQLTLTSTLNIPEGRTLTVSGNLFTGSNGLTGEGTLTVDNGIIRSQESQEIRTLAATDEATIAIYAINITNGSVWDASEYAMILEPNYTLTVTDSQMICSTITFEGKFTEEHVINLGEAPLVPQDDGSDAPEFNITCVNGIDIKPTEGDTMALKFKYTGGAGGAARIDLKGTTKITGSTLTLDGVVSQAEIIDHDGTATLSKLKLSLLTLLTVSQSHTMDDNSELELDAEGEGESKCLYKLSGTVDAPAVATFAGKVSTSGTLEISTNAVLTVLTSNDEAKGFSNTGMITNEGTIISTAFDDESIPRKIYATYPGSEVDGYGVINIYSSKMSGLALHNQQLYFHSGTGEVTASLLTAEGEFDKSNTTTIEYDSTYTPPATASWKIKRLTALDGHTDVIFAEEQIHFPDPEDGWPTYLPQGDKDGDLYPAAKNPGFLDKVRYKRYKYDDTIENFAIAAAS